MTLFWSLGASFYRILDCLSSVVFFSRSTPHTRCFLLCGGSHSCCLSLMDCLLLPLFLIGPTGVGFSARSALVRLQFGVLSGGVCLLAVVLPKGQQLVH